MVLSPSFLDGINRNNPKGSKGVIASAYKSFLLSLCNGRGAKNPSDLRSAIISKYKRFSGYGQQDSQELLGSLLDGLHEDLNQSAAARGTNPPLEIPKDPDSWQVYLAKNSSPIVNLFSGKLYSSIECPNCGNVEAVFDPFVFLSVPIPKRSFSGTTLQKCLDSFCTSDTLDADNKWRCDKCHQKVQATKKTGIQECAQVLIIHLKRFSGSGYSSSKIDTSVDYPDILESRSFCNNKDSRSYKLIGAVFHHGSIGGGHYTSAAIDPNTGDWYNFNDSTATKISQSSAHSNAAYILFYLKQ